MSLNISMSFMYPISHLSLVFDPDFVILEVWELLLIAQVKHNTR